MTYCKICKKEVEEKYHWQRNHLISWNKGLTKETDKRVKASWNKGLTKETDKRLVKIGRNMSKSMLGKSSPRKDKTLEEYFRKERAKEIKDKQSKSALKRFENPREREKLSEIKQSKQWKETKGVIAKRKYHKTISNPIWKENIKKNANKKISETRKRLYKEGKLKSSGVAQKGSLNYSVIHGSWCRGLTKELDERVRRSAEKMRKPKSTTINMGKYKRDAKHKKRLGKLIKKAYANMDILTKLEINIIHSNYRKGSGNGNWKNGLSFIPYPVYFNNQLRNFIRIRDNYVCKFPGCGIAENGRRHCIHHIDYDKNNCNPENLVTLCVKHHVNVNANRSYWSEYFKSMLVKPK